MQKIIQIFKIKELRDKIFFVFGIFVVFRLLANITIPGVTFDYADFFERFQIFGLASAFTGGALDRFSVVMLGLGPYITATIVLQLLTMVFPQLEQMQKEEGEAGRQKINQYGRLLTIPFSFLQGYGMLVLFQREGVIGAMSLLEILGVLTIITAGTVFLMWLGELITEKGIGNGVSLLILAGIVSDLPSSVQRMLTDVQVDPSVITSYLLLMIVSLITIMGVVFVTEARRNIPVSYAKRVRGNRLYGGVSTYLPLSINPAGVIPIIFAFAVLFLPVMVANFFVGQENFLGSIATWIVAVFESKLVWGGFLFLLVGGFTYFYTAITFNPSNIADNLKKMGGFIPGIRPGQPTASFINYVLNRILFVGAIFLGFVAVLPTIVEAISKVNNFQFLIGGASVLIVVSVVLETIKQINAQLQMRDYEKL
jgi:preprotein translocase subunit SecY